MQITFHGAARVVTGSKHLLQLNNGVQILLDCGMFQGMGHATDGLNHEFGFDPTQVNYMVLSHAHIDHVGLLPRLIAQGYGGQVFATPATIALAKILLLDSAKIQQQDAEYLQKHGRAAEAPLYTEADVTAALQHFVPVEYDTPYKITPHITLTLTDAGHIIGSAAVHLDVEEDGHIRKITFSGDVGRYNNALLRSPQPFRQADFIITESTYGSTLHKHTTGADDLLLQTIIQTCVKQKGKVIIPAFSVGRTQELLYALNNFYNAGTLPQMPVYVDSPLSFEATKVMQQFTGYYNLQVQQVLLADKDIFAFPNVHFIQSVDESKQLNESSQPCVIIAASGMAEAGRIVHHIKNNIGNPANTILLVGYADERSLAGQLKAGHTQVQIFNQPYTVAAAVRSIDSLSAHGDYEDLLKFLSCQDPQKVTQVALVHGDYDVQQVFAQKLTAAGFPSVVIPQFHETIGL